MKANKCKNTTESKVEHKTVEVNVKEPKIMAYNFVGRLTHAGETPTAIAIAPPNRLLLGLPNRSIEVRDLKKEKLLFLFRTANQVTKLIHCLNGDYVAALETKRNFDNEKINYVRIYVNWNQKSSEDKMFHPCNVRRAGQHFHVKTSDFEMVEILGPKPDNMECCQISGNILIQSGKLLTIHEFKMKKLDVSALRYVDFEKVPFHVKINFVPSKIAICENYISCLSKTSLNVFKIEKKKAKRFAYYKLVDNYKDYKKLMKRNDVVAHLPGVVARNNPIFDHCEGSFYDNSLTCQMVAEEDDSHCIVNFIQAKLKDLHEFSCLVLKPLYVQKKFENGRNAFPRSKFRELLGGVTCFVSTLHQGFLYQFNDLEDTCDCVAVYSFVETVYDVVLGSSWLHALTKNGLELYTANSGEKLFQTLGEPSPDLQLDDDSVLLLDHHEASGFVKLFECDEFLVLLEDNQKCLTESIILNWKLLHLELPTPEATALSPEGYLRQLKEIQMMLRLSTVLTNWILDEDNLVGVAPPDHGFIESYRKFCALLADYFLLTPNYELSLLYYKMGSVPPHEVVQRFKSLQAQKRDSSEEGMIHYLTVVLSQEDVEENQKFLEEVESFFEKHEDVEVAPLVLHNKMLQKSTGKLFDILHGQSFSNEKKETERLLALTLLYLQNGSEIEAQEDVISMMDDEILQQILEKNWRILFDSSGSFSKLCLALLLFKSEVVVQVLTFSMFHDETNPNNIIHALQEFDKMKKTGIRVTQKTLELYLKKLFKNKNSEDIATMVKEDSLILRRAVKNLVISYWAELKRFNGDESQTEKKFLFEDLRYTYLNLVPSLPSVKNYLVLKKLEALFCSFLVLLLDADAFVEANNHPSLKSILLNSEEALLFLLETHPECLPQFGKDRFTNNQQWKVLVSRLREKSESADEDVDCKFPSQFYQNLLDKTLTDLANNFLLDEFEDVLCNQNEEGMESYEAYVTLCRKNMRANEIQKLIQETARQSLLDCL